MTHMFIPQSPVQIYLLYFFYGLTFLILGTSVALKDMKASGLKISGCLWLLSFFGFSHGTTEWIELILLIRPSQFTTAEFTLVEIGHLIIVSLSFLSLLEFGLVLLFKITQKNIFIWFQVGGIFFFLIFLIILLMHKGNEATDYFLKMNFLSRKTLGLFGSLTTSIGLGIYSREVKKISRSISRYFLITSFGFFFYSIFTGLISSHFRVPFLAIPIELFRALTAVVITYFLMKALNIFDIETRNKLAQQIRRLAQSEKMASLGQLAAGVAHEINTPLTKASLSMQMLRTRFETELDRVDITNKLDAIERNIDRAAIIARELLQFSHIEESTWSRVDINDVINNSLTLVNFRLNNAQVQWEPVQLPSLYGDAARLEQVLINILNNSVEAMPDGGKITLSTIQRPGEIEIVIVDTGTGIPEENLSKVFDPFYTTKAIGQGTGLGLSICYGIIEQHHGRIELSGSGDKGTTVTIHLPVSK